MSEYRYIKCDNPGCINRTTNPKTSEWFVLIRHKLSIFDLAHNTNLDETQEDHYDLCSVTCLRMFVDELEAKE